MPVCWKLGEEYCLKWPETWLFRSAVYITSIIEKLIITHQEPIESTKVWILLGCPSKYCNYTSKRKLGRFPHSPWPPSPQWITFLILISQKILWNMKDVEFDFRVDYILVLFPVLWIINVQFTNIGFLNFQCLYFQN